MYWLNGRWFLQIVDRDSGNLCPIDPVFPCSDFLFQMWGCFGGMFFLHFMLFPTFLENKNYGIKKIFFFRKTIIFHLMYSLCFCYARFFLEILKSPPSLTG